MKLRLRFKNGDVKEVPCPGLEFPTSYDLMVPKLVDFPPSTGVRSEDSVQINHPCIHFKLDRIQPPGNYLRLYTESE